MNDTERIEYLCKWIQVLQEVKTTFDKCHQAAAEARAKRLLDYQAKADFVCQAFNKQPIEVSFGKCGTSWQGFPAIGSSTLGSIRIAPGLALEEERSVFCHELAHQLCDHTKKAGDHESDVSKSIEGLPQEMKIKIDEGMRAQEGEAHSIGATLLAVFWPGSHYSLLRGD